MKSTASKTLLALVMAFGMVTLFGCGGKKAKDDLGGDDAGGGTTETKAEAVKDPATVTGTINFEGTAPAATPVQMDSDPVCAGKAAEATPEVTQEVAVKDGKLANVFVYISKGLEGKEFPVPAAATIDQEGCRYRPHVMGVMVGQTLKIKNSDQTMHNVHVSPATNAGFNLAQPTPMETEKKFDKEEIMVPFSCDVHGWMHSYVGVLTHPCFGVSGTDGKFKVENLPAGTYTITAWHEKYGKQEQQITVGAKETKDITFTFKAQ